MYTGTAATIGTFADLHQFLEVHVGHVKNQHAARRLQADQVLENARAMLKAAEDAHAAVVAESTSWYNGELARLLEEIETATERLAKDEPPTDVRAQETPVSKPKAECPGCGRLVQVVAGGGLKKHTVEDGTYCKQIAAAPATAKASPLSNSDAGAVARPPIVGGAAADPKVQAELEHVDPDDPWPSPRTSVDAEARGNF